MPFHFVRPERNVSAQNQNEFDYFEGTMMAATALLSSFSQVQIVTNIIQTNFENENAP